MLTSRDVSDGTLVEIKAQDTLFQLPFQSNGVRQQEKANRLSIGSPSKFNKSYNTTCLQDDSLEMIPMIAPKAQPIPVLTKTEEGETSRQQLLTIDIIDEAPLGETEEL